MNSAPSLPSAHRITAGALLIATPLLFTLCFTLLQLNFNYPDILREPAPTVLARYHADSARLLPMWYGMMLSAVVFIALAVTCSKLLHKHATATLVFGVLAGLVQAIGLSRWVFAVPTMATTFADPSSSAAQREATLVMFNALHTLLGVGVGEHLGYLFTAAWTLLIGHALMCSRKWLAWSGILCALGIAAGTLEPWGHAWAGGVNAIAYTAWSLWLVVLGVLVLCRRMLVAPATPLAA